MNGFWRLPHERRCTQRSSITGMSTVLTIGAALALPGGAIAQVAAGDAPATPPQVSSGSSAAATLEEVVVTAQKRSERLVDVPVSVATVSEEALTTAGRGSIDSLTKIVPGLVLDGPGFQLTPTIRGIGATAEGAARSEERRVGKECQ